MDGWLAAVARVGAVAADAVSVVTADVAHLSGCNGSKFWENGQFWLISVMAAMLNNLGRFGGSFPFHIKQNTNTPAFDMAAVLGRHDAVLGDW